jgi:hypothetical protein
MINDYQVISVSKALQGCLAKLLQASRFPFDGDPGVFFTEMASGREQWCKATIVFPGYSAQSLRLFTLHFGR